MKLSLVLLSLFLFVLAASCATTNKGKGPKVQVAPVPSLLEVQELKVKLAKDVEETNNKGRALIVKEAVKLGFSVDKRSLGSIESYLAARKYIAELEGRLQPKFVHEVLKFVHEVLKLVFASIAYKLSTWAVSDVFPEVMSNYPVIQGALAHPDVQSAIQSPLVQTVVYYASGNFGVTVFFLMSFFGVVHQRSITGAIRFARKSILAMSFGLLCTALLEMFFYFISSYVPEESLDTLVSVATISEPLVLVAATYCGNLFRLRHQFTAILIATVFIFARYHFHENGKYHADMHKTFTQSVAAADLHNMRESIEYLKDTAGSLVNKGVNLNTGSNSSVIVPPTGLGAENQTAPSDH